MRRKGFTLVELLAVIVILAVIALITIPRIIGIIEEARKNSAKSSALGYIDAVEKQIARNLLDSDSSNDITDGTYSIEDLDSKNVRVNGDKPSEGWVKIKNGKITNYSLKINNYAVSIENGKAVATKNGNLSEREYDVGEAINYDPTTNQKCTNPTSTTGTKTGCMKWYVIKDNNSSIDVILDHNTTARIKWNDDNINVAYENSNLKDALASDTTGWTSGLNPRLIAASEIKEITGNTNFSLSTGNWYCFGSNTKDYPSGGPYCNKDTNKKYAWLFNNTNGCSTYGCTIEDNNSYTGYGTAGNGGTYGYWTATTVGNATSGYNVWRVCMFGRLDYSAANNTFLGVRPVITISKSNIS